jgi:hypothetical protein
VQVGDATGLVGGGPGAEVLAVALPGIPAKSLTSSLRVRRVGQGWRMCRSWARSSVVTFSLGRIIHDVTCRGVGGQARVGLGGVELVRQACTSTRTSVRCPG